MATQATTDSFYLRSIPNDIYDSPLKSMVIWSTDLSYKEWAISLFCEPSVRGMKYVQLRLKDNDTIYDPVYYGPEDTPRATTTIFTVSGEMASSRKAIQLHEMLFVEGTTFRLSDFVHLLREHIPGYQLLENNLGSQGWVVLVVDMLVENGTLPENSKSLLNQAIDTLKATNPVAQANVADPIAIGNVLRGQVD